MQFAVIGAGSIGEIHAQTIEELTPEATVAVVVGRDPARTAAAAARHRAESSLSLERTLARDDIDAVAICTPSGTHADLCVRALEAGKHVVVEKPLDVTMDAACHVVDAQRRTGGTLTVISQHRFDPASLAVHEAIGLGRLGRLTSGLASVPWWRSQAYYDSADWRGTRALDGGVLLNQGIHTIDLLVWFLGIPMEVFAWTGRLTHERIEAEDTAVATLRFAGGTLGVLHSATSAFPGLSSRLQIHGDKGSAVIDADHLTYFHTSEPPEPTPVTNDDQAGIQASRNLAHQHPASAGPPAAHPTIAASLRAQYRDFLSAVQYRNQPLVTAQAAARTLSVVDAIYRSAATGLPAAIQPVHIDARGSR